MVNVGQRSDIARYTLVYLWCRLVWKTYGGWMAKHSHHTTIRLDTLNDISGKEICPIDYDQRARDSVKPQKPV